MAERVNGCVDSNVQPDVGVRVLIKTYSIQSPVKVPLWPEESVCGGGSHTGESPDRMIVTEVRVR